MQIVRLVKTMVETLRFAIAGLHNWYHTFPYAMSFRHIPAAELVAVAHDNEWAYLLTGWGLYFLLEMGLAVIIPMLLFASGVRNRQAGVIRVAAVIAVLGIIWNRINTSLICFNWQLYQEIPHWKEVWITITLYAFYFITYRFIVYRLPIVYEWKGEK